MTDPFPWGDGACRDRGHDDKRPGRPEDAGPDNAQPVAGDAGAGHADANGPLVYAALGSGLAGLVLGAVALLVARRRV